MKTCVLKNIISSLTELVDTTIKEAMSEFIYLGASAKKLHKDYEKHKPQAMKIYTRMQNIYHTLRPFNSRVKELYPNLTDLFDVFDNTHAKNN